MRLIKISAAHCDIHSETSIKRAVAARPPVAVAHFQPGGGFLRPRNTPTALIRTRPLGRRRSEICEDRGCASEPLRNQQRNEILGGERARSRDTGHPAPRSSYLNLGGPREGPGGLSRK
jgi:hypothetical protein